VLARSLEGDDVWEGRARARARQPAARVKHRFVRLRRAPDPPMNPAG
jgi:hypothetical protein